jgi:hypothetical protein
MGRNGQEGVGKWAKGGQENGMFSHGKGKGGEGWGRG